MRKNISDQWQMINDYPLSIFIVMDFNGDFFRDLLENDRVDILIIRQ